MDRITDTSKNITLATTSLRPVIIFNFRPQHIILKHTLIAGGSYVNQNPDTLAFDLLGRLLDFYEVYDDIRQLLHDCDSESRKHSALLPLFQCYEAPSGVLLYILEDHTKVSADATNLSKLYNKFMVRLHWPRP